MKEGFAPGVTGHAEMNVREEHSTRRDRFLIFSTPNMVQLVENAAINALQPYLDANEISVGTRVDIQHLGPSLLGARVRAEATATGSDRAAVWFRIEVYDGDERVGVAEHQRFVLESERYMRRLEARLAGDGSKSTREKEPDERNSSRGS